MVRCLSLLELPNCCRWALAVDIVSLKPGGKGTYVDQGVWDANTTTPRGSEGSDLTILVHQRPEQQERRCGFGQIPSGSVPDLLILRLKPMASVSLDPMFGHS